MHGTYETVDGRPTLRFERRLAHPVERAWQAVTEPAELAHWFPAAVTVDLRPGGAMSFAFAGGDGSVSNGAVTELDPPRRFAFSWGTEELRFDLEPEGEAACRLVFTHVLGERDTAARVAAGWDLCFEQLARHLDGQPASAPGTGVTPEWRERYDDYVRRGLPAGAEIPDD